MVRQRAFTALLWDDGTNITMWKVEATGNGYKDAIPEKY